MTRDADAADRSTGAGPPVARRTVLRFGAGGALAVVIGAAAGIVDHRNAAERGPASPPAPTSTVTTTTEAIEVPVIGEVDPGLVALGRRVAEVEGHTDPVAVLRLLDLDRAGTDGSDPMAGAAARVRDEFASGTTLVIDGWILAESEARAAAVIALLCADAEGAAC